MKERPILFSAPMVRALLGGSKTQTRRPYKVRKHPDAGCEMAASELVRERQDVIDRICPYGQPGDRLWVRETFQGPLFDDMDAYRAEPADFNKPEFCEYAADGGPAPEFVTMDDDLVCRWRPNIHMPRWASRILLEIVSVRVERLNDISAKDATAEGTRPDEVRQFSMFGLDSDERAEARKRAAIAPYERLWESINGAGSWAANPWVWVVEFKRVTPC